MIDFLYHNQSPYAPLPTGRFFVRIKKGFTRFNKYKCDEGR